MNNKKIKILVISNDNDGVGYYRINSPYLALNDPDIDVKLFSNNDFTFRFNEETLKDFNVIVYHKGIPFREQKNAENFAKIVNKYNIKIIFDIDDYWVLDSSHINYKQWKKSNSMQNTINQIKSAHFVTTTTPFFASEISKHNPNVIIFENAINHKEQQWTPNKVDSDKTRFIWGGGITHKPDLMLMKDSIKMIDKDFYDKSQLYMCGFDLRIRTKNGVFVDSSRKNMWGQFESIFTSNEKHVKNPEYFKWLREDTDLGRLNYGYNEKFKNEFYQRRWTKPIFTYGTMYNEADVALAPLKSLSFNKMKCIVGDSLISTINGFIKIEDLVNNKINTQIEINGKINKINNYFKYKNENTVKITTKDGYTIEGTPTHRIYIKNGWVELKKLKIGDIIELTKPLILQKNYQHITYPMLLTKNNENKISFSNEDMLPRIVINEKWGRLIGYLIGDGHMGGKSNISVSCDSRHVDIVEDVYKLFEEIGLNPIKYNKKPDKRCKNLLSKEGNSLDIKLTSKTFVNIARKYKWIGKNGKIFRIPNVILQSPKSVIREFLRGLFESDGTVSEHSCVNLTSKDLKLIEQVQTLLLSFGIKSKIGHSYNKQYRKYYYTLDLRRKGSDIFYKEIGFISKQKTKKLETLINGKRSNNEHMMIFEDSIINIEYNKKDVFDIEINNIHSYNANGLINHNSQLKVIEAGIHKCPVIASDFGPYTIDVKDGKNGFLINENDNRGWYDKMKWFIENPNAIKDMGESLNELVLEKYTLDKINEKRIQFFKSIVK